MQKITLFSFVLKYKVTSSHDKMFKASLNYKYHSNELQSLSFLDETKCPKVFTVNEFLLVFSCFDLNGRDFFLQV